MPPRKPPSDCCWPEPDCCWFWPTFSLLLPFAAYLPPGTDAQVTALSDVQIAVCAAPGAAGFEPRLIRNSVIVKARKANPNQNKLDFDIEADLWAQPYPERLYLKTELDLERGAVVLTETNGRDAP